MKKNLDTMMFRNLLEEAVCAYSTKKSFYKPLKFYPLIRCETSKTDFTLFHNFFINYSKHKVFLCYFKQAINSQENIMNNLQHEYLNDFLEKLPTNIHNAVKLLRNIDLDGKDSEIKQMDYANEFSIDKIFID